MFFQSWRKGERADILNRMVRGRLPEEVGKLCECLSADNSEQRDQPLQSPMVGGVCLVKKQQRVRERGEGKVLREVMGVGGGVAGEDCADH